VSQFDAAAPFDNGYQVFPRSLSDIGRANGVVISEFRFRGPNGGNDEFVELYNGTSAPIDIGGWKLKGSNNAGTITTRATVANGVSIPAHGHFLFANNNAAGGYSGSVTANQPYTTGITDDGGIAITTAAEVVIDQVGSSAGSAFKEGSPLTSLGSSNLDRSYERKPGGADGSAQDTGSNAADFAIRTPSDPQNLASAATPATLARGGLRFPVRDAVPGAIARARFRARNVRMVPVLLRISPTRGHPPRRGWLGSRFAGQARTAGRRLSDGHSSRGVEEK
jgi:hypothetical protein